MRQKAIHFNWGVRVAASLKESKSGVEFVNNLTLSCEFESQPSEALFFFIIDVKVATQANN